MKETTQAFEEDARSIINDQIINNRPLVLNGKQLALKHGVSHVQGNQIIKDLLAELDIKSEISNMGPQIQAMYEDLIQKCKANLEICETTRDYNDTAKTIDQLTKSQTQMMESYALKSKVSDKLEIEVKTPLVIDTSIDMEALEKFERNDVIDVEVVEHE